MKLWLKEELSPHVVSWRKHDARRRRLLDAADRPHRTYRRRRRRRRRVYRRRRRHRRRRRPVAVTPHRLRRHRQAARLRSSGWRRQRREASRAMARMIVTTRWSLCRADSNGHPLLRPRRPLRCPHHRLSPLPRRRPRPHPRPPAAAAFPLALTLAAPAPPAAASNALASPAPPPPQADGLLPETGMLSDRSLLKRTSSAPRSDTQSYREPNPTARESVRRRKRWQSGRWRRAAAREGGGA